MRRLLPALLAAAASLPVAAFAADPWYPRALATLERAGVTMVTPKVCPEDYAGIYMPTVRSMVLCPQAFKSSGLLRETVAHEMVHVAQNCAATLTGKEGMLPLTEFFRHYDPSLSIKIAQAVMQEISGKETDLGSSIQHSSDPSAFMLEAEAYAFQSNPDAVMEIVNSLCSAT